MMEETASNRRRFRPTVLAVAGLFHLVGVALVFVLMVGVTVPLDFAASVVGLAREHTLLWEAMSWPVLIQLGLAGCVWSFLVILWKSVDLERLTRKTPRVVRRARGTVITETLIALPVLLILMLGMMQLSINNITGILKHVAGFQAARTVWVWEPEQIDEAELEDRVRIAVALAMAPVAPGNFSAYEDKTLSHRAQKTRDLMVDRFESYSVGGYFESIGLGGNTSGNRLSVAAGLDGASTQALRAERKFTHAYQTTEINELYTTGDRRGADVSYYHFQAMPLVGRIFGEPRSFYSENSFFQEHRFARSLPAQLYGVGRPGNN